MTPYNNYSQQKGVVLIISLIMLLVLTIVGVTSMRVTGLEEKMAGNLHNNNMAFQAAESSLRGAENWIVAQTVEPAVDSVNIWPYSSMDSSTTDATPWWFEKNATWWTNNAVQYTGSLTGVSQAPYSLTEFKYFKSDTLTIGSKSPPPGIHYYQITALGNGSNTQSRVMVQSIMARRF